MNFCTDSKVYEDKYEQNNNIICYQLINTFYYNFLNSERQNSR